MVNIDKSLRYAVVGAGAVGCYFGGLLAKNGASVVLIGREHHTAAILKNGLFLDSEKFKGYIPVEASTLLEAANGADVVLFCVKSKDTQQTARALAPFVSPSALVLSIQNGVENPSIIRQSLGITALPVSAYVAASMSDSGCVLHSGIGRLVTGFLSGDGHTADNETRLEAVATQFNQSGAPCEISDNIEGDIWMKLILNCAINPISALSRSEYGAMFSDPHGAQALRFSLRESIAVAKAAGIILPIEDVEEHFMTLGDTITKGTSSMEQDIAKGRRTEIDTLNGYITRRGRELGVPTPVNETLFALVRLLQEHLAK